MSANWTSEQKKAIEKEDCNLIVAAAAGSGKTAVLVEKIVNMIQNGADVDSLLVTTFTDAAAKKMKQEIGDEIKNRLMCDTSNTHLARQLVLLGRADICTIDAFCMKIVRANFHLLDIDPDFKIADSSEAELLRMQAAEEVFADLYEKNDEAFYDLLECYANERGDDALIQIILSMHSFMRTMPDYKAWIEKCVNMYKDIGGNIFESEWGKVVFESACIVIEGCINRMSRALEYASTTDEMNSYVVPIGVDVRELREILCELKDGEFDKAAKSINAFKLADGGRAKPKTPDEIKEPVSLNREYVKKRMAKLAKDFFCETEKEICDGAKKIGEHVKALCDVVQAVEEHFFDIKNKRGVLDFADIEHLALKVLTTFDEKGNAISSEAACELKEKYNMILIDEYQDSNELQETIFSRISRGNNIFMVGDLKQSIYRFRHTNPLLFKHKKDTYADDEGINQRVIMAENFRSRKSVIDFVNLIMAQNASQQVGELDYDATEALNFAANYPREENSCYDSEVHIIDRHDERAGDDSIFGIEAEAVRVAKRILQLRTDKFEIFDKKEGLRPLKYRDIVILMRAPNLEAQIFSQVLTNYGIPTFSDVGGGYFVTDEVELMLSLLSVIDNPVQDIKLLGVMRSVIGGFDDTELAEIRLCDNKSDIYGALCSCAKTDTEIGKKCASFIERLDGWRKRSLYMPVHELIQFLYTDTGYYDFVGYGGAGEQRRANLNMLFEYARSYEKTSFKGLFNFVSYTERIKNSSHDLAGAKILGENQDVVRIMSIHKSKGLEFGVVFVTRLAKDFYMDDLDKNVLMHNELGIGVNYIDVENRYKYPTFIKRAIREKLRYELLSEELRVLYVALTRAREKLILTLAPGGRENKKKKWLSGVRAVTGDCLPLDYTASATGLSDWIMGALMRHESCREYVKEYIPCAKSDAKIKVYTFAETAAVHEVVKKEKENVVFEGEYSDLISQKLGYVYPYEDARKVPTKVSVTELKRIVNNDIDVSQMRLIREQMIQMPSFLKEKTSMSAAQRGSALHFVMQNLDLLLPLDEEGVKMQIERMLSEKMITSEHAQAVSAKKISDFFESELGKRMLASKKVVRESPFEIAIDASQVIANSASGEEVLLQGIIDSYFYEDGEIVLVDYKTDKAHNKDDIEKIKNQYALQLELYAHALEKITNISVKEKNLYLFSCESVIKY